MLVIYCTATHLSWEDRFLRRSVVSCMEVLSNEASQGAHSLVRYTCGLHQMQLCRAVHIAMQPERRKSRVAADRKGSRRCCRAAVRRWEPITRHKSESRQKLEHLLSSSALPETHEPGFHRRRWLTADYLRQHSATKFRDFLIEFMLGQTRPRLAAFISCLRASDSRHSSFEVISKKI